MHPMFRDEELRQKLEAFLRPLYQDLDGASRVDEAERIGDIAYQLYVPPGPAEARALELLLAFHLLGSWLDKVGNLSRTTLAVGGIEEAELRRTAVSIRRLNEPVTDAERAVAAAALIDRAGVRGLAERFAAARREGRTVAEVAREALHEHDSLEWLGEDARAELERRRGLRNAFCLQLLDET
jgi:hypothetical protein